MRKLLSIIAYPLLLVWVAIALVIGVVIAIPMLFGLSLWELLTLPITVTLAWRHRARLASFAWPVPVGARHKAPRRTPPFLHVHDITRGSYPQFHMRWDPEWDRYPAALWMGGGIFADLLPGVALVMAVVWWFYIPPGLEASGWLMPAARIGLWAVSSLGITYLLCQFVTLGRYHAGMRAIRARKNAVELLFLEMLRLQVRDVEAGKPAPDLRALKPDDVEYLMNQLQILRATNLVSRESMALFLGMAPPPEEGYPQA